VVDATASGVFAVVLVVGVVFEVSSRLGTSMRVGSPEGHGMRGS
jgi:hypothetical protein